MRALIEFGKDRFIGHLDTLRSFQRAVLRSRLPVAYSQGFHPHMLIAFASALPVGQAGLAECADVSLSAYADESVFFERLRDAMPNALPISRVRLVLDAHPRLAAMLRSASYDITLDGDTGWLAGATDALLSKDEYIASRVSKTKTRDIDIRAMIHELSVEGNTVHARVAFTEDSTLKPDLLLKSLCDIAGVAEPRAVAARTGLYGEYGGFAVPLMDM